MTRRCEFIIDDFSLYIANIEKFKKNISKQKIKYSLNKFIEETDKNHQTKERWPSG